MNRLLIALALAPILASGEPAARLLCGTFLDDRSHLYGYVTCNGERVEPARYALASDFSAGGLSWNMLPGRGLRYINRNGDVLVQPFAVDNGPDYFSEGYSRYVEGGLIGFINEAGRIVVEAQFEAARPVVGGNAEVGYGCEKGYDEGIGEYWKWECNDWQSVAIPK